MNEALRENTAHGSWAFPFALYHMHRMSQPCAFTPHWHEELEIIFVQQGELNLTIAHQDYLGLAGDVFIVNSREIHAMSVTKTPTVYVTALFLLSSLRFLQEDEIDHGFLRPLAEHRLRFPNRVEGMPQLLPKLEQLVDLYHGKQGSYMLRIRTLLLDILCDLQEAGMLAAGKSESPSQDKQRQILAFIQENYLGELTLETVAAEFHMVPKYFSRYFKNTFHMTLTDYINRLRLEQAADQLRHTELTVTEIALQTGFNSSSYFNKKFRSVYKKTPSQYRAEK